MVTYGWSTGVAGKQADRGWTGVPLDHDRVEVPC